MKYKSLAGKSLQIIRSFEIESDSEDEQPNLQMALKQVDHLALKEAAKTEDVRQVWRLDDNGAEREKIFEGFDNLLNPSHPILHSGMLY